MWWKSWSQTFFLKVKVEHIFGLKCEILYSLIFILSEKLAKYIETKVQTYIFASYKAFLLIRKRSGTSLTVSFSA